MIDVMIPMMLVSDVWPFLSHSLVQVNIRSSHSVPLFVDIPDYDGRMDPWSDVYIPEMDPRHVRCLTIPSSLLTKLFSKTPFYLFYSKIAFV